MILNTSATRHVGRFAPTPSGPLHLGSLVTALASFLEARCRDGRWLLRIDDLDAARCPPGMDARIRRQLEAHGLQWDGTPRYQSAHLEEYRAAHEHLAGAGVLYHCLCTRAQLRAAARVGPDGAVYPGTCRDAGHRHGSQRVRLDAGTLCFDDGWQGRQCRAVADEVGDFVVRRRDGVFAYQLACAVDEDAQGITDVVRGADLLPSTFPQLWLQRRLDRDPPAYRHLPVVLDEQGRKLSKQNRAPPVAEADAAGNLLRSLALLGQAPPPALAAAPVAEVLGWATTHWSAAKVPRAAQMPGTLPYNAVQHSAADEP